MKHEPVPLLALADNEVNGNARLGHIALVPEGEAFAAVAFVDQGNNTLHACASMCGDLTTDTARTLGQELIKWADRRDGGG